MSSSSGSDWWATKVRQSRAHLRATVKGDERRALETWLTPAQLALFDGMHVADQRHGLDVMAALRAGGDADDREVLEAGLLHDVAKGDTGLLARIAYSLGQAYGRWVWRLAGLLPGFGPALDRLRDHPAASGRMAAAAGCSARTVALIEHQDAPIDPEAGQRLRLADEAN